MTAGEETALAEPPAKGSPVLGAMRQTPTIKGIFVNTHVAAVRRKLGAEGVKALEKAFGASVRFPMSADVPIRDEVRLIEAALDLTAETPIAEEDRSFEAGRLHFRNFSTTGYARALFMLFPRNFKFLMLHAKTVAERVFNGVTVEPIDTGLKSVDVILGNNDYPIDHFRGLFYEWLRHFEYEGDIRAEPMPDGRYRYHMMWE